MSDTKDTTKVPTDLVKTISSDIRISDAVNIVPVGDAGRPQAVRTGITKIIQAGGKLEIIAAELLFEVRKNDYWKNYTYKDRTGKDIAYSSFDEYVENEVPFGRRKAFYLMSIYEKFIIELEVPADELKEVEWSKAKEILPVISKANYKELLNILPKVSLRELQDIVSSLSGKTKLTETKEPEPPKIPSTITLKAEEIVESESDKLVTLTFKVFKAQADNLKAAMEVAKFECGSDKDGNLIDMIASEFISSRAVPSDDPTGTPPAVFALCSRMDRQLQNFERVFKVKLEVKDVVPDGTTAAKPTA